MPKSSIVTGRLSCHPEGYGFVVPDDPSLRGDIFIPPKKMRNATHGDQVSVRLVSDNRPQSRRPGKGGGSLEGEVLKVLRRARDTHVGKVFHYRDEAFVSPLDPRYHFTIRLVDDQSVEIPAGRIVVVAILVQPGRQEMPLGEIVEVLGDPDDPEIQYKIVCHKYGIPMDFPEPVLEQAEEATEVRDADLAERRDLRSDLTVTIDGETARDFDDAVSIDKRPDGSFLLKVHIADVAHYVTPDSAIDTEALVRGTSVYFPDRAIPMLPHRLSNGLCSLNPGVDRLAVSVEMEVDRKGMLRRAEFYESVINSNERMTYTSVRKILVDRDASERTRYGYLLEMFESMAELCDILHQKRVKAGAIDFDLPEPEIEYSLDGSVRDVIRGERTEAHRIIEEFMLLANQTVAEYLTDQEIPLLYRVHDEPDPMKVDQFLELAGRFGYSLEPGKRGVYTSGSFQRLAEKLSGQKEGRFLSYLMLRSFKQARYSAVNYGHFGLAMNTYTHFTSPIRRYPDLVVHRILKARVNGSHEAIEAQRLYGRLEEIAEQSSDRERKAVEAERELMKWIMAGFMKDRIGEEFEAFITGMKHNGFFVELLEHFVEGFVPVQTVWDDFYVFNERAHCFIGETNHRVFRIGDQVRVRVDKVNLDRHLIDFSPVIKQPAKKKKRRK
jgi:ribonuclease R